MNENKIFKEYKSKMNVSPIMQKGDSTNAVVYSFDLDTSKFTYELKMNGQPLGLANASEVNIILHFGGDNPDKYPKANLKGTIEDKLKSIVSFVMPKQYLGFDGQVLGEIDITFENGQSLTAGYFSFVMKPSYLNGGIEIEQQVYVEQFEDLKNLIGKQSEDINEILVVMQEEIDKSNAKVDEIKDLIVKNDVLKKFEAGSFEDFREWDIDLINKMKNEFSERGINLSWYNHYVKSNNYTKALEEAQREARNIGVPVIIQDGVYNVDNITLGNHDEFILSNNAELRIAEKVTNNAKKTLFKVEVEKDFKKGNRNIKVPSAESFEKGQWIIIYNGGWYDESKWIIDVKNEVSEYARYQICKIIDIDTSNNYIKLDRKLEMSANAETTSKAYVEEFGATEGFKISGGKISLGENAEMNLNRVIDCSITNTELTSTNKSNNNLFIEHAVNCKFNNITANLENNSFIWLARGSRDNEVTRNRINAKRNFKRDASILVYYDCINNTIKNNYLNLIESDTPNTTNTFIGIAIHTDSRYNKVRDNEITGEFDVSTGSYFGCYYNDFRNNLSRFASSGHVAHSSKNDAVKENIFFNNKNALYMAKGFDNYDLTFSNNQVIGCSGNGVAIAGNIVRCKFRHNDFKDFDKNGFWSDANIDVKNCIFEGNNFVINGERVGKSAFLTNGRWVNCQLIHNIGYNIEYMFRFVQHISFSLIAHNIADEINTFSVIRYNSAFNLVHDNQIGVCYDTVFQQESSAVMNDYQRNQVNEPRTQLYNFTNDQNLIINSLSVKAIVGTKVHFISENDYEYIIKVSNSTPPKKEDWKLVKRTIVTWG